MFVIFFYLIRIVFCVLFHAYFCFINTQTHTAAAAERWQISEYRYAIHNWIDGKNIRIIQFYTESCVLSGHVRGKNIQKHLPTPPQPLFSIFDFRFRRWMWNNLNIWLRWKFELEFTPFYVREKLLANVCSSFLCEIWPIERERKWNWFAELCARSVHTSIVYIDDLFSRRCAYYSCYTYRKYTTTNIIHAFTSDLS